MTTPTEHFDAIDQLIIERARACMDHQPIPRTATTIRAHVRAIVAAGYAIYEPEIGPLSLVPRAQTRYDAPRWLAHIADACEQEQPIAPVAAPRKMPTPAYDRPVQHALPLTGAPRRALSDAPLNADELSALSRKGWELTSSVVTSTGLTLITMTLFTDSDRPTEQHTADGWRMELV